jgi:hypothetical protein
LERLPFTTPAKKSKTFFWLNFWAESALATAMAARKRWWKQKDSSVLGFLPEACVVGS